MCLHLQNGNGKSAWKNARRRKAKQEADNYEAYPMSRRYSACHLLTGRGLLSQCITFHNLCTYVGRLTFSSQVWGGHNAHHSWAANDPLAIRLIISHHTFATQKIRSEYRHSTGSCGIWWPYRTAPYRAPVQDNLNGIWSDNWAIIA